MTISKFFDAVSKLQPNLSDYSDEHKRVCGVREVVLENLGINNAAASITPRRRTRRALLWGWTATTSRKVCVWPRKDIRMRNPLLIVYLKRTIFSTRCSNHAMRLVPTRRSRAGPTRIRTRSTAWRRTMRSKTRNSRFGLKIFTTTGPAARWRCTAAKNPANKENAPL